MSDGDSPRPAAAGPVWRTSLDIESQDAERYPDKLNEGLFGIIDGA